MAIGMTIEDLGTYDDQDDRALTLNDWIRLYRIKTGITLNPGTVRKRRAMSGLGRLIPPKTYLLSKEEFEAVLATPLPMCKAVIKVS
jgi:hypothetical protein